MYSESEDFRSVWILAHEWAGYHPEKTELNNLPVPVKLNLQRLAASILNRSLRSQTKRVAIFVDDSLLTNIFETNHFLKLLYCKWGKSINKDYLQTLYVRRPNFLEWCEKEKLPNPDFWVLTEVSDIHKVTNRPKSEAEDKAVCRAIAKVYWGIDPNIHPSHMVKSKAIRIFGNGNQYKDDKTIKSWIADLDPQQKK
jgi:hypothetical protein